MYLHIGLLFLCIQLQLSVVLLCYYAHFIYIQIFITSLYWLLLLCSYIILLYMRWLFIWNNMDTHIMNNYIKWQKYYIGTLHCVLYSLLAVYCILDILWSCMYRCIVMYRGYYCYFVLHIYQISTPILPLQYNLYIMPIIKKMRLVIVL